MKVSKGKMAINAITALFFIVPAYSVWVNTYDLKTAHNIIKCLEACLGITIFLSYVFVCIRDGIYKIKVKQFLTDKIKEGGYINQDYEEFILELDRIE